MKPNPKEINYEKVVVDGTPILGIIEEIQREPEHKGSWQGKEKISDCVRFKFKLDGYQYAHYSRWMTFTYGDKSNLLNKYLIKLVEGASPDMDFDLELLKGMRVKTIWGEKNGYQHIESIFPEKVKIKGATDLKSIDLAQEGLSEEAPF